MNLFVSRSIKTPIQTGTSGGVYPEREEPRSGRLDRLAVSTASMLAPWLGPKARDFDWIVGMVDSHAGSLQGAGDGDILNIGRALQKELRVEGFTRDLTARSFALAREVAGRTLAMRHFDVQLIGGCVLLHGMVAEMETGEGKTLTATLPACVAALAGVPVHIVTVNDYLAARDAEWMGPIYRALGLTVGTIKHGMDPEARRAAYRCNVTYCTNKEVVFDYLRDRIALQDRPSRVRLQLERLYGEDSRVHKLLLRGLHFAIVDEADSVLIDEARTPLIISGQREGIERQQVYHLALALARELEPGYEYSVFQGERRVELTEAGRARIRDFAASDVQVWPSAVYCEELVRQALAALHFFARDREYLIRDGKVQIIDEYTGRVMADRSWEKGLHQIVEAKEGCEITGQVETLARISYQRFFRRYLRLAGMTGTAREVAGDLLSVYGLLVQRVPTNRPLIRVRHRDRIFSSTEAKWKAVVERVHELHREDRPVLVGTRAVAASEHLSRLLEVAGLKHQVLNAKQDNKEAEIIAGAGEPGCITIATNMAGRGTDIRLGTGVAEKQGLHVILTERHEAGRIDRQLWGRCGRQGDPGTYEAIVSLEDSLIRDGYGGLLAWIAARIGPDGPGVRFWMARLAMFRAQKKVEQAHARMRRDLLKQDEQIGDLLAFSGTME